MPAILYFDYNRFFERHICFQSDRERIYSFTYNSCCLSVYLLAFQQYACLSDITLPKALDLELSGDIENCLIDIGKDNVIIYMKNQI